MHIFWGGLIVGKLEHARDEGVCLYRFSYTSIALAKRSYSRAPCNTFVCQRVARDASLSVVAAQTTDVLLKC
jgi:hypothetical protein